jgi:acyl CoA:acetate/3-ketoacid CoA transferase alpha subunit
MKNKIYPNFDAAVADIPDGITFMSPGFGNVGVPRNLLAALHRQGAKHLTVTTIGKAPGLGIRTTARVM